jgi:hypothetical protein
MLWLCALSGGAGRLTFRPPRRPRPREEDARGELFFVLPHTASSELLPERGLSAGTPTVQNQFELSLLCPRSGAAPAIVSPSWTAPRPREGDARVRASNPFGAATPSGCRSRLARMRWGRIRPSRRRGRGESAPGGPWESWARRRSAARPGPRGRIRSR